MRRWLGREKSFHDRFLLGFWPLLEDLKDHSGGQSHLLLHELDGGDLRLDDCRHLSSHAGRNCLRFLGDDEPATPSYARVSSDVAPFQFDSAFSVGCWVKPDQDSQIVLGRYVGTIPNESGWFVQMSPDGLTFYMGNDGGFVLQLEAPPFNSLACWKHVFVTYDGSSDTAGMKIYVDGRRMTGTVIFNNPSGIIDYYPSYFSLGLTRSLTRSKGGIRLVRIHDRELSQGEIFEIFKREQKADTYKKKLAIPVVGTISTVLPGLTLTMLANEREEDFTTLFMNGMDQEQGSLPLMVRTDVAPTSESELTLYVSGSDQPNVVGTTTLYMNCEDPLSDWMPLFLQVSDLGRSEGEMPLYMDGEMPMAHDTLTLHLANDLEGVEKTLKLFLQVDGTLVGGQTENNSLPLFLKRPFEDSLTMVIQGPGTPAEGSIDLVMACNPIESASVDLVIPQTVGVEEATVKMFVLGF